MSFLQGNEWSQVKGDAGGRVKGGWVCVCVGGGGKLIEDADVNNWSRFDGKIFFGTRLPTGVSRR
jgi:hypothetical protein